MLFLQEKDNQMNSNPKVLMQLNKINFPSDVTIEEFSKIEDEKKSKKLEELEYYSQNLYPKIPILVNNINDKTDYCNNDLSKTLTGFFNTDGDANFHNNIIMTPALSEYAAEDSNFLDNFFTT